MLGALLAATIANNVAKNVTREVSRYAAPVATAAATAAITGAVQNGMQQRAINQAREVEQRKELRDLYAKLAICCYIARADGAVTDAEKRELDLIYNEIAGGYANIPEAKNEITKIYNNVTPDFVFVEGYMNMANPEILASFLTLAEAISRADSTVSESEDRCIYNIKKYLTDRTGRNYLRNVVLKDTSTDLVCPGCSATMKLDKYNNTLTCPYCGQTRYVEVKYT